MRIFFFVSSYLSGSHFNVKSGGVNFFRVAVDNVLTGGNGTGWESLGHGIAPDNKAQGNENSRQNGHSQHPNAQNDVNEQSYKRGLLLHAGVSIWQRNSLSRCQKPRIIPTRYIPINLHHRNN